MNAHRSTGHPQYPRWLGLLPVAFVIWASTNHKHPAEVLWLCNVCNLLLAVGLFTDNLRVLWLAVLWLMLGAPLCLVFSPTTTVSEVSMLAMALFATEHTHQRTQSNEIMMY